MEDRFNYSDFDPDFEHAKELRRLEDEQIEQLERMRGDIITAISPSKTRTRIPIHRDWERAHDRLWNLYFSDNCKYPESKFRRRFRMRRSIFFRIQHDIEQAEPYFTQRPDAIGRLGRSSLQKISVALRMLAYGAPADMLDESFQMGESTAYECVKNFCRTLIRLYSNQYLREPTTVDLERLFEEGKERGFPGMLGSLDCMHWKWKNFPTAWHGHFRSHKGVPTVILEAVASRDLWIWHAFFGMSGSNNDITVLDHSPLFKSFINGENNVHRFEVNRNEYTTPYYLTDGIYPEWSTLVQSISYPRTAKEKYFASKQEAARKYIERAFGVLQGKWMILHGSARFWHTDVLGDIMMACLILHNMIIEDERHENVEPWTPLPSERRVSPLENIQDPQLRAAFLSTRLFMLRDRVSNRHLKNDLMDHLWNMKGEEDGPYVGGLPLG